MPVIFENELFKVKMGKGALKPGYLQLIPKRHIYSFAELNEIEKQNCHTLLHEIKTIFYLTYGFVPMFWENGTTYDDYQLNRIYHAHLHVLPHKLSHQAINYVNKIHQLKSIDFASNELQEHYKQCFYLLYIDPNERAFIAKKQPAAGQFMRRIIAAQEQIPLAWDWHEISHDNNVQLGLQQLAERFAMMQNYQEKNSYEISPHTDVEKSTWQ